MKEKVRVREIIPLLQFDINISLAEATTGEKSPTKKPFSKIFYEKSAV
jgi:hypothetical protein